MDVSVRTGSTYVNEDQRWIGNGGMPIGQPRSIVLDRSGFDLVTTFPNGVIPSGIALARDSATGLYIPYGNQTTEVQSVGLGAASAGTVTIGIDGETTSAIAFNATKATVQAAINALSNVDEEHTVTVGGADFPGVMTFTYGGLWAGEDMPALTVTPSGLTGGTVTIATPTAGGVESPAGEGTGKGHLFASVAYDRDSTGDIAAALFWSGEVVEDFLPANHGVDAAFKADCTHIAYV